MSKKKQLNIESSELPEQSEPTMNRDILIPKKERILSIISQNRGRGGSKATYKKYEGWKVPELKARIVELEEAYKGGGSGVSVDPVVPKPTLINLRKVLFNIFDGATPYDFDKVDGESYDAFDQQFADCSSRTLGQYISDSLGFAWAMLVVTTAGIVSEAVIKSRFDKSNKMITSESKVESDNKNNQELSETIIKETSIRDDTSDPSFSKFLPPTNE